jgi:hypothetical protein
LVRDLAPLSAGGDLKELCGGQLHRASGMADILGHLARQDDEDAVTIASAGAIPLLVQLLTPGPRTDVPWSAARALQRLAANSENAVTMASAGAIPPLAQSEFFLMAL